jgi:hypothetical protein
VRTRASAETGSPRQAATVFDGISSAVTILFLVTSALPLLAVVAPAAAGAALQTGWWQGLGKVVR